MNEKTEHILNASSSLLGFCFFILVSIKTLGPHLTTFIDEVVAGSILLFTASSFLSFLSIRNTGVKSKKYEFFADYIFVTGLASLLIISILLFLNMI